MGSFWVTLIVVIVNVKFKVSNSEIKVPLQDCNYIKLCTFEWYISFSSTKYCILKQNLYKTFSNIHENFFCLNFHNLLQKNNQQKIITFHGYRQGDSVSKKTYLQNSELIFDLVHCLFLLQTPLLFVNPKTTLLSLLCWLYLRIQKSFKYTTLITKGY